MESQSAARPESIDYDSYLQRDAESDRWDPIAATPDVNWSPSPPRPPRVAFAAGGPQVREVPVGVNTPSSVGLGIESDDQTAQFPGYHPIVSRDSFEQDSLAGNSYAPPPPLDPLKSTLSPQEYALGTPGATPYYGYSPHPYENAPLTGGQRPPPFARLKQSWAWKMLYSGWPMYATFCAGFAFAVGHHAFYDHLDGQPADDQIRMMRFGGLLSYASKAFLAATVMFAYRQQIWVTAISNVLRLRTIDHMFAALEEPIALLDWEFLKKAPLTAVLGAVAWLVVPVLGLEHSSLSDEPR